MRKEYSSVDITMRKEYSGKFEDGTDCRYEMPSKQEMLCDEISQALLLICLSLSLLCMTSLTRMRKKRKKRKICREKMKKNE